MSDPKDHVSTIAGGSAGMALMLTVRWELVPHGEMVKVGAALTLIVLGYCMYRGDKGQPV